jgi:hypothetical protein
VRDDSEAATLTTMSLVFELPLIYMMFRPRKNFKMKQNVSMPLHELVFP